MSLLYPIVTVVAEVVGKTIDKFNFKKNHIKPTQEIFLVFITMAVLSSAYTLLTTRSMPVLTFTLAVLILLMVGVSFLQNVFEFNGLFSKDLAYRELFVGIQPLLTSFLAVIFFPSEREIKYVIGIILGVAILYFGSYENHWKFKCDKGTLYILLGIFCSAILSNIYKVGLDFLSPQALFMVRTIGVLALLFIFGHVGRHFPNNQSKFVGSLAGFTYFIGFLMHLLSIKYLGINLTILILFLHPVLAYFMSFEVLKEKISVRRVVSNLLLILVVIGIILF